MKPWHGVLVATATPYDDKLQVKLDLFGEHVAWLAASGCDGVTPNGSLGEYQVLSDSERAWADEALGITQRGGRSAA